jgi:ribonuclease HI
MPTSSGKNFVDWFNHQTGTGLVLVENQERATGYSNVRTIQTTKSIVCAYLAILDALRLIKKRKMNRAIIVTDQKPWTKGITVEGSRPYMKEFYELLLDLKEKVEIKLVGELDGAKKNLLLIKAEPLSRKYKKATFGKLEFE